MKDLAVWLLEPLEPLVFGDGRPATAVRGLVMRSRELPPPTQIAGVVRTRAGSAGGQFDKTRIDELLQRSVLGPHLVRMVDGRPEGWLFPAPADAWVPEPASDPPSAVAHPLVPLALEAGEAVSGPLAPVGHARRFEGKPWNKAPRLWTDSEMLTWLTSRGPLPIKGAHPPMAARRIHVSIDPRTGTAADGALYGTTGRVFDHPSGSFALAVRTDAAMNDGLGAVGGERRLARWRRTESFQFPELPRAVRESARAGTVRVTWITPASFEQGSTPSFLLTAAPAGSALVAQANGRPEVISGWDFANDRPKPTRRLLPAGSVTWLTLGGTPDEREAWAAAAWGRAFSDDEQSRRDGLGVILLGTWDGAPTPFDANSNDPSNEASR